MDQAVQESVAKTTMYAVVGCHSVWAPIAIAATLVTPLAWATPAVANSTTLKAVVFDDVKPLYQKTDSGYEGLGVDVLEQIRMQARRCKVDYSRATSVRDGLNAVITGKADIACGVAFTWGRSTQLSYTLPFGVGGNPPAHRSRHHGGWNTQFPGRPNRWSGQGFGLRQGAQERGAWGHTQGL